MNKFDPTKPARTRDGQPVKIESVNELAGIIHGIINGVWFDFSMAGQHHCSHYNCQMDLENIPEPIKPAEAMFDPAQPV